MLMSHSQCLDAYGSNYQIKKQLSSGTLYRLEAGVYSTEAYADEAEVLAFKYPYAVFTMESAWYYHHLTDVIPERYCLATDKDASKIKDPRVRQIFCDKALLTPGLTHIRRGSAEIPIYDRERMLIELLRNKATLPYDYYKEILVHYRTLIHELDIARIQDYAGVFPKSRMLVRILQSEVF